jgi:tagatose-6-phosphate ketose/aldose isomerase
MVRELTRDARAGAIVVVDANGAELADYKRLAFTGMRGAGDVELALVDVVFAQVLALQQSLQLGLTPDNPNPSGVVSRVVRGVTIHPWFQGGVDVPRG